MTPSEQARAAEAERHFYYAKSFGLACLEHVGLAISVRDRRIAHAYHELAAYNAARRAAHAAFRAVPALRGESE